MWIFAVIALVIGFMLLFGVAFGSLTPHFVAVAIICLALALLWGPVMGFVSSRRA